MPPELGTALQTAGEDALSFSAEEFVERVVQSEGVTREDARHDIRAVLTTVAETTAAGDMNDVFSQIQADLRSLLA